MKNGRIHTSGKNNAHNNYKTNPTLCDQGNNYKIITIKKEGINKKKNVMIFPVLRLRFTF